MQLKKIYISLEKVIDQWQSDLSSYTMPDLISKPDTDSWSMGQVYMHLINSTLIFQLGRIRECISTDANKNKKKNFKGVMSYHILGDIPPIKIKVPPSPQYTPPQPSSMDDILTGIAQVRKEMAAIIPAIETAEHHGKAAHPGFSYLSAEEWYRLVLMHWRHHRRQKARLDSYLITLKNK